MSETYQFITMRGVIKIFVFVCLSSTLSIGQIYCPDDIVASCFSSLTIQECGNATVISGNYHQSQVKFVDDNNTNACNEGTVFRKFYIDIDYSNDFTAGEPFCTQTITLEYDVLPLNIQFPGEIMLSCIDDVPVSAPTWSWHPCDLVGFTYEDEEFDFEAGACKKIIRTYSVINWCEYESNTGQGLYEGIQIIKIVDNEAPEIADCEDKEYDAVENCEATVVLTNSATDNGNCPSGMLQWTVSVDLWADGTEDLFYGPNEPNPFRITPIGNGEEISIELPEAVGISNHKVVWSVTDGCGNFRTCSNEFVVADNKPPTPYCLGFLSATLDGWDENGLVIPVSLFVKDALDNCSSKEEIRFSFSENVDDTERVIECGEIGFQFFRIYYTDLAGNQDFCEVFMFVLDNGSCAGTFTPQGRILTPAGNMISDVETHLMEGDQEIATSMSNEIGEFEFGDQSLMDTYYATAEKSGDASSGVDVVDYKLMMDGLLGKTELSYYQRIAGDINKDQVFDLDDLRAFKDVLTGDAFIADEDVWSFVPMSQEVSNTNIQFDAQFSIMDYQEGFSFWGVKTGDLSGAVESLVNDASSDINLTLDISDNAVTIYNQDDVLTSFFKMNLNYPVTSPGVNGLYDVHSVEDAKTTIVNLSNYKHFMNKNELSVTLDVDPKSIDKQTVISDVVSSIQFLDGNAYILSDVNWTIIDTRTENTIQEVEHTNFTAFPSPFTDQLSIEGSGIVSISMFNVAGQRVSIKSEINTRNATILINEKLTSGLYMIELETETGTEILKVVK